VARELGVNRSLNTVLDEFNRTQRMPQKICKRLDNSGNIEGTTNSASYEALPFPLSVCILLCSSLPFPMLA
jgi:hypothetical protein